MALSAVALPQAAKADFIYGIADDNNIYQVDTDNKIITSVFSTQLSGLSNALAYDAVRKQLFFVDSARNLRFWDGGPSLFTIAPAAIVGGSQPANAVYYDDSFWYFTEGSNILNQIAFDYTNPTLPTAGTKASFSVGPSAPNLSFGDIAVDAIGKLYGATTSGSFFSVDLADPTKPFNLIKAGGNPSLQLSFSADFNTLFGQDFTTGQWYTVDQTSGVVTAISGYSNSSARLRDLGGAGRESILPVPAPLPLAGAAVGIAWSRRLRKRIKLAQEGHR